MNSERILSKDYKSIIVEIFVKLGLISADFTGKIILNLNQGGLTDVEKTERLK